MRRQDIRGIGRLDIPVRFVVFSRFVEIKRFAAETRRLCASRRHFRFGRLFGFRFLLRLFLLDLKKRLNLVLLVLQYDFLRCYIQSSIYNYSS